MGSEPKSEAEAYTLTNTYSPARNWIQYKYPSPDEILHISSKKTPSLKVKVLYDLEIRKDFLNRTQKALVMKKGNDKMDNIK